MLFHVVPQWSETILAFSPKELNRDHSVYFSAALWRIEVDSDVNQQLHCLAQFRLSKLFEFPRGQGKWNSSHGPSTSSLYIIRLPHPSPPSLASSDAAFVFHSLVLLPIPCFQFPCSHDPRQMLTLQPDSLSVSVSLFNLQLTCVPSLRIALAPVWYFPLPTLCPRTFVWTDALTPGIPACTPHPQPYYCLYSKICIPFILFTWS